MNRDKTIAYGAGIFLSLFAILALIECLLASSALGVIVCLVILAMILSKVSKIRTIKE